MKHTLLLLLGCVFTLSAGATRDTASFNDNWKFARFGAMPNGSQLEEPKGMEKPGLNDSRWLTLNLPHDWAIEGPFRAELPNQTGKLPWAGIGWYRKSFDSPESDAGKRVFIEFDGSMSRTKVWLNGEYIGEWPYGYSSFQLELTGKLKVGQENTIAVRLDNKPDSSRWYPGGGIYRNVRLVKTGPVHVAHWGTFVTTPKVSGESATIHITTQIEGASADVEVSHEVLKEGSNKVLASGNGTDCSIELASPKLWDLENPNLYQVKTTVFKGGEAVDRYDTSFGIRTIKYTANGFFLNGKRSA